MKIQKMRLIGLTILIVAILKLAFVVMKSKFGFVPGIGVLDQDVGFLIATYRVLDMVAIAFLVFASVACCIAMLRPEEKRE